MKQCRFYKEGKKRPDWLSPVFWLMESNYVDYGDERGPYEYKGFGLYYERYGERTYRGIPYGILTRLYLYALEKDTGDADSLTKFHEWMDYYIKCADPEEILRKTDFMGYIKKKHKQLSGTSSLP